MDDTYERTYSVLSRPSATADDYAIACALAEDAPKPRPDTSLDHSLALQLHEKEVEKLVRPPSQTKHTHRHDHSLRALLRTLNITKVIPRLNPLAHPTATYVSQDRQRLLLRLDMYALQERQVTGDGNCQFRAIADQLYSRQDQHTAVRQAVVEQLCNHPERYRDYVTTDYQQYVSSMSTLGTWGDHVTLQAAADAFHARICIISSFLDDCVISIYPTDEQQHHQEVQQQRRQLEQQLEQQQGLPGQQQPASVADSDNTETTVWLAFWAEVHYNSLAAKAPESPSSVSTSSEDEANSTGSAEGSPGKRRKLLGSKKLKRAADAVVPSMLRHS